MRIVTYVTSGDVPPNERCFARIRMPMPTKGGEFVEQFHPVIISAQTEEEAATKAQDWYDAQIEAEHRKIENAKRAGERMKTARQAKATGQGQ